MGEVRNPFGVRNGRIVTISDLSLDERGHNCNCLCPDCGGHFIARLGDVRKHHFAHDGSPCDPVRAIMTSLYMLLQEAVDETQHFTFPNCYGVFSVFPVERIATWQDIRCRIQHFSIPKENGEQLIEARSFEISASELVRNGVNEPQALILTEKTKQRQLAIVLVPPESVCKRPVPKPFRDYSTVCIYIDEDLYQIKSYDLKKLLRDGTKGKKWISSPAIDKWANKILERQHQAHQNYLEEQKKKQIELEKLREQQKIDEDNRRKERQRIQDEQKRQQEAEEKRRIAEEKEELENYRLLIAQKYEVIPEDEQIRDEYGRRWHHCTACQKWCLTREMNDYGGSGWRMNRGICTKCSRASRR